MKFVSKNRLMSKLLMQWHKPVSLTGFLLGGLFCGFTSLQAATPNAPSNAPKPPIVTTDSVNSKTPLLDPNLTPYPRSALHSFDGLLDAPAGKYGFLTSRGAHFYWPNGKRARFWGINVANTSLQEPEADIDAIVENFRTAGFNLLRLHHFDERGGIIDLDKPDSRQFNQAALAQIGLLDLQSQASGHLRLFGFA